MMVDIDVDLAEAIVKHEMYSVLHSLQKDRRDRAAGKGIALFHLDQKKDLAELDKHIKAFKLVLKYYSE
jgi:hypothetical protein